MGSLVPRSFASYVGRFTVAPDVLPNSVPQIAAICETISLLAARQNRDGSWGRHAALDKLICTCHVTMALVASGLDPSSKLLTKARRWLCEPRTGQHNNSYWIVSPLASFVRCDAGVLPVLQREIQKLSAAIDKGAQPHPDQYSEAIYLRVVDAVPQLGDEEAIQRYVRKLQESWNAEEGWAKRADTTTSCYVALQRYAAPFAEKIKGRVIQLLEDWVERPEPKYAYWRNPISTAYTIMNIAESRLFEEPLVLSRTDEAAAWLLAKREDSGLWASDLPYGGTGDVKSPDFPTAAVLRAFIAHLCIDLRDTKAAVLGYRIGRISLKVRRQRLWISSLGTSTLVLGGVAAGPAISAVLPVVSALDAGISLGVLGIVISLVAWWFPDARDRVRVWLRHRSGIV